MEFKTFDKIYFWTRVTLFLQKYILPKSLLAYLDLWNSKPLTKYIFGEIMSPLSKIVTRFRINFWSTIVSLFNIKTASARLVMAYFIPTLLPPAYPRLS